MLRKSSSSNQVGDTNWTLDEFLFIVTNFPVFDINSTGTMIQTTVSASILSLRSHQSSSMEILHVPRNRALLESYSFSIKRSNDHNRILKITNPFLSSYHHLYQTKMSNVDDEYQDLPLPSPEEIEQTIQVLQMLQKNQPVINKFNIVITREDIETLEPKVWLSDQVINFYFQMIAERSAKKKGRGLPLVFSNFTQFWNRYLAGLEKPELFDNGQLLRWTKNIDLQKYDIILFPHNVGGNHWTMTAVDVKKKELRYYDSIGSHDCGLNKMQLVLAYLRVEYQARNGSELPGDWSLNTATDIPEQFNGFDCGVFSCQYAERVSRRAVFDFDHVNT